MIRASLLALFSTLIICGFCGKEFVSLDRHSWRCKSKVDYGPEIRNSDITTTIYLPVKCSNITINECGEIDHYNLISKNFWGYVKRFFKKSSSSLPSFNLAQCTSYFIKTFSSNNPNKTVSIPS